LNVLVVVVVVLGEVRLTVRLVQVAVLMLLQHPYQDFPLMVLYLYLLVLVELLEQLQLQVATLGLMPLLIPHQAISHKVL
jgi:hypothetical protein